MTTETDSVRSQPGKSFKGLQSVTSNQLDAKAVYEQAKVFIAAGRMEESIPMLRMAVELYRKEKNYDALLMVQNSILRIHAERMEYDKINQIKEEIQDLVLKEGIKLSSKTYYVLGVCAAYKNQVDLALDYFQKALTNALGKDSKEDMVYAISGVTLCYVHKGRLEDALSEIYNLKVFFEVLNLPELKLNTQIINAMILRKLNRYDEALDVLWTAYEELKSPDTKMFFYSLLYNIGATYFYSGNKDLAKVYLQLAKRSIDEANFKRTAQDIDNLLIRLGASDTEFDLVINEAEQSVREKTKGHVEFKNQFILLDLLNLFVKNPGKVFSKEDLVEMIWGQEYNPSVHDNKVYVTIKRLRKLIEPDIDKPHYIFRGKNGYYLNKAARVLLEN
ncbi:MAG: helix-turn-helix domain-containing protein [Bdellovibrionota bacterium]|nr:helix-turn-helix domain-containing protein [Bdellovibrionota bacterium]